MMRVVFWILLVVNAILFGLIRWGGLLVADEPRGAAQPALHEEQIRLQAESSPGAPVVPPASSAVAASAGTPVCLEWGEFSGADLTKAAAALAPLQLGNKLSQRQVEHTIGYWVYIPPIADKNALNQKIAQLKARGVKEYFVVQEPGQWLNAISLGVFKTEETAKKFLDELRAKGVRSAQTGERATRIKAATFSVTGVDEATAAKLASLQKDFAGSELKNVSCPLTR